MNKNIKMPCGCVDTSSDTHATPETCGCGGGCSCRAKPRYGLLILAFAVFYLVTVMPVGLLVYNIKSNSGINVFSKGGYHTYLRCIQEAVELR